MFVSGGGGGGWIYQPVVDGSPSSYCFPECLFEWGFFVNLASQVVKRSSAGRSGVPLVLSLRCFIGSTTVLRGVLPVYSVTWPP